MSDFVCINPEHPLHVIPIDDLIPHIEAGTSCPCIPRTEEGGCLVIHRSWDEREATEGDRYAPTRDRTHS